MTAARQAPGTACHSGAAERLTREAIEITAMAEELSAYGLRAEAVSFALAAAEHLRAVRALSRMVAP
jgi:hypothetical protein